MAKQHSNWSLIWRSILTISKGQYVGALVAWLMVFGLGASTIMEINYITALGLAAGILTTLAYLPQVIKTWQSKSAQALSWSMLIILCIGIVLWLVYGFAVRDIPIIAANMFTLLLASIILALKIRYRNDG
jgi:MtN3 and saliva related transmembrane protein